MTVAGEPAPAGRWSFPRVSLGQAGAAIEFIDAIAQSLEIPTRRRRRRCVRMSRNESGAYRNRAQAKQNEGGPH